MHENRETSETPAAQPGRRSAGEGLSHKARAYDYEESHSGILPMNHSNKDGTSPAESGEERPLIKENAGQPNTYPTQSGKGVSQGLAGVRKADGRQRPLAVPAIEDKLVQQAVVTILNQIYEEDFLDFSYGFRPGRSQHQALDALSYALLRKKVNYVLDADIRGFFDNLDK